ncbi:MAG: hypothetical protein C0592_08590 [Marinilabiliales bacterium]|nr:MAG: hypothetical protein C0592_08590 [Marinilabiliales bacterium]
MRGFILSFLIIAISSLQLIAQDNGNIEERFIYGIENVGTLEQINSLERNMLALDFIGELKFDIKLDKGTARMEFTVVQPDPTAEGRKNIDMAEIKRLIIEGGMTPIECTKVN